MDEARIPRVQPFSAHDLGRGFGGSVVTLHDGGATYVDSSQATLGERIPRVVDDAHIVAGEWRADAYQLPTSRPGDSLFGKEVTVEAQAQIAGTRVGECDGQSRLGQSVDGGQGFVSEAERTEPFHETA